jgi:hypothetical protein
VSITEQENVSQQFSNKAQQNIASHARKEKIKKLPKKLNRNPPHPKNWPKN